MPLEICDAHFLAGAVVYASEHINAVVVVLCAVKEASEGHRRQFDKLQSLQIQDHGVLGASTVVMSAQNDHLVRGDEHCGLCLH